MACCSAMCSERAIQGTRYCLGATTKSEGTGFSFGGEYERRLSDLLGVGVIGEWSPNFRERVVAGIGRLMNHSSQEPTA